MVLSRTSALSPCGTLITKVYVLSQNQPATKPINQPKLSRRIGGLQ